MTIWLPMELEAWAPPRRRSLSEWSDENRVLSRLVSAEPGPWRTARTPYLREIQDAFQDRRVEQITLAKSTQVGGTEAFHNVIAWTVRENPVPIVLVMPRDADVGQVIGRRLKPMFEESAELSEEITGWAGDWKTDELAFRRCILYGRASNSAAALASVAGGLLIGDECDKWPRYVGREASPWELAKERTRTFPSRKIGLVSTPTVPDGLIWKEYLDGDRRRFHVPCPHCGDFQVLQWDRVRWLEELEGDPRRMKATPSAAWYECGECGGRIEDPQKRELLAGGIWVPEAGRLVVEDGKPRVELDEELGDHRSFHLWAGYSPWLTWSEIVATHLLSRDDEERRRNFVNSWLGEPWTEVVEDPTADGVRRRVRAYARDTVPDGAEVHGVTMGVDVQKTELPYVVRAWGPAGDSWLLRAGSARSWDGIEELLETPWAGGHRVGLACVDSRYRTEEVYELARDHPDQVRAIQGVAGESVQLFQTTKVDRHPLTGRPLPRSLMVWRLRVEAFRDRLAKAIASEEPSGWQIHADVAESYLRQLSSQEKVQLRGGGGRGPRIVWRMKAGHRHDHAWDAEVYALAASIMLGLDRRRRDPPGSDRIRKKVEAIRDARAARRANRQPGAGGGFLGDLGGGWT